MLQSVDDIAKDLERYKLEAKGVKDEFLSSEPTEDDTKWVRETWQDNKAFFLEKIKQYLQYTPLYQYIHKSYVEMLSIIKMEFNFWS